MCLCYYHLYIPWVLQKLKVLTSNLQLTLFNSSIGYPYLMEFKFPRQRKLSSTRLYFSLLPYSMNIGFPLNIELLENVDCIYVSKYRQKNSQVWPMKNTTQRHKLSSESQIHQGVGFQSTVILNFSNYVCGFF